MASKVVPTKKNSTGYFKNEPMVQEMEQELNQQPYILVFCSLLIISK